MVQNVYLACALVLFTLTLSSVKAYGQLPPPHSYLFVEIKDTSGQLVTDASVALYGADGKQISAQVATREATISFNFPIRSDHHYSLLVSKNGFLPSEHVFFPRPSSRQTALVEKWPLDYTREGSTIVLRKPPTTASEREAVDAQELQAQLILAAKRGDPLRVSKLLQLGVGANAVDAEGVSALAWASFAGDADTINALLEGGARVNTKNPFDSIALLIYFAEGILRDEGILRGEGRTSNTRESRGDIYKRERVVSNLIKAGADVNAKDPYLGTALNAALRAVPTYLQAKAIEDLLRAGANANTPDEPQRITPLMWASQSGSIESVKLLLAAGASIHVKDKTERTALMWAQVPRRYSRAPYDPEIVKTLLSAGAKVNESDENGFTPLILAAQADRTESVKLLLAAGAQVNVKNKWGSNALILAFDSRFYAPEDSTHHPAPLTIRTLLSAGADIHAVNPAGMPPLMLAARTGSVEALKMLLEAGTPINVRDKKGQTALMYNRWEYMPTVEALKVLIAAKADLNAVSPDGRTALMFAASGAPLDVLNLLLEASPKASINARDNLGQTALMHAVLHFPFSPEEQVATVKALLAAGADLTIKDIAGRTALGIVLAYPRNPALIELLKSKQPN